MKRLAKQPGKEKNADISARPASEFAATKRALSAVLGVSRPTVDSLFRRDGCPLRTTRGFHIPAFIEFAQRHLTKNTEQIEALAATGASGVAAVATVREQLMLTQMKKIEQQMAITRGEYISRETLADCFTRFLLELDLAFSRQFEQELPQALEGMSAVEIKSALRAAYQEVKQEFQSKTHEQIITDETFGQ